ncbi:MAG: exodeoxyribonuclease VII small subunit [Lachnospiraceae bacterium]|nr:exodeoxyribonuclease VII small subunit [Candidatus Colinaster equi]
MAADNGKTLEEIMNELEECVAKLESSDISLEDSFREYEAGMKLVKECNDRIDGIEKKVQLLEKDGSVSILDEGTEE